MDSGKKKDQYAQGDHQAGMFTHILPGKPDRFIELQLYRGNTDGEVVGNVFQRHIFRNTQIEDLALAPGQPVNGPGYGGLVFNKKNIVEQFAGMMCMKAAVEFRMPELGLVFAVKVDHFIPGNPEYKSPEGLYHDQRFFLFPNRQKYFLDDLFRVLFGLARKLVKQSVQER